MMSGHVLKHITGPPDYGSACSQETVRVDAGHSNVAQLSPEQQPQKDQVRQDSSKQAAGSGPAVSVGREKRPALLPRQSVATAKGRFDHKGDERDA